MTKNPLHVDVTARTAAVSSSYEIVQPGTDAAHDGVIPMLQSYATLEKGHALLPDGSQHHASDDGGSQRLAEDAEIEGQVLQHQMGQATMTSCYINLASTIVGAGFLGVPYAFAQTGYLLGTLLFILAALLSWLGLHLLSVCAVHSSSNDVAVPSSFYTVAQAAAPQFSLLIDASIAIKCLGIATSYLIVIGDSLPLAMEHLHAGPLFCSRTTGLCLSLLVVTPISFLPSLDAMRFTSTLSGIMILMITLLVVLYSMGIKNDVFDPCYDYSRRLFTLSSEWWFDGRFSRLLEAQDDIDCIGSVEPFLLNSRTPKVLGIFLFGFSCQQNTFAVVNELRHRTQSRMDEVFWTAISSALLLYVIVSSCGYATYGNQLKPDILVMYPLTSLTSLCRLMISFIVTCHYPLQLHPGRRSLLSIAQKLSGDTAPTKAQYNLYYYTITTLFLLVTYLIAFNFEDLGVTLSVVGATGSILVISILPGAMFYSMHVQQKLPGEPVWKQRAALITCCFGICIVPFCLIFIFLK